jgi:hypothetical protein
MSDKLYRQIAHVPEDGIGLIIHTSRSYQDRFLQTVWKLNPMLQAQLNRANNTIILPNGFKWRSVVFYRMEDLQGIRPELVLLDGIDPDNPAIKYMKARGAHVEPLSKLSPRSYAEAGR